MLPLRKYPFLVVGENVDWKDVNPKLLSALNQLGRTRGQLVTITSGYRTYQQQAALYAKYKASGFNIAHIAAKPGQSNHESGNAVDVTIAGVPLARAVKASELATYGLRAPVKGDPVHTELAGSTARVAAAPAPTGNSQVQSQAQTPLTGSVTSEAAPPAIGTPPAAQDPSLEMPGTAQHYLPGSGPVADSWQSIAQLPDLAPDTQRLIALATGG